VVHNVPPPAAGPLLLGFLLVFVFSFSELYIVCFESVEQAWRADGLLALLGKDSEK
jgi:hypothetical protein